MDSTFKNGPGAEMDDAFRFLAEAIPQIVWTARPDGAVDYFNLRWYTYSGMTEEQSLGWGWNSAVHPEDVQKTMLRWNKTLGSGETYEADFRLKRSDGAYRWHLGRAVPLRDALGEITQWFGTLTDIDDQKRAAEEITRANVLLARARDEAIIANRVKTSFLANMSHELRTPLNAILGYGELLEEDARKAELNESFLSDIGRIREAGEHLLQVINSILDISRIESGRLEMNIQEFEINPIIDQVMGIVLPLANRRKNKLLSKVPTALGRMTSDAVKVRQVLFNVLSNACKFTENGNVTLTSERTSPTDTAWIIFTVCDTGIGIASEQMQYLFKDFSQIDHTLSRRYGGTGLGLAISRKFVFMMGGTINVASEPGKGSTFTVRLPVVMPPQDQSLPPRDFE